MTLITKIHTDIGELMFEEQKKDANILKIIYDKKVLKRNICIFSLYLQLFISKFIILKCISNQLGNQHRSFLVCN